MFVVMVDLCRFWSQEFDSTMDIRLDIIFFMYRPDYRKKIWKQNIFAMCPIWVVPPPKKSRKDFKILKLVM